MKPGTIEYPAIGKSLRHQEVLASLRAGNPAAVIDDRDHKDGEGVLVFSAEVARPSVVAKVIRWTAGFLLLTIPEERAAELELPLMYPWCTRPNVRNYGVSFDAADGITTGISAADRATTCRVAAAPGTIAKDLTRPGHMIPVRVSSDRFADGDGLAAAISELMRCADLGPVAVYSALTSGAHPERIARARETRAFAEDHNMPWATVSEIVSLHYLRVSTSHVGQSS